MRNEKGDLIMNSFDINVQIEEYADSDFYEELMAVLEEMAFENYRNSNQYRPEAEF